MGTYQIIFDAFQEAKWFQSLSTNFVNAKLVSLNEKATDSEVKRLIRYDRPDIILLKDGKAVLTLEKTTEVPTGHNIGQRFARIVCSAEESVPFIYFLPFVAMKHGTYPNPCWLNARLVPAMNKLSAIHNVPVIAVNWECDKDFELIRNGTQDAFLKKVLQQLIATNFDFNIPEINEARKKVKEMYKKALERNKSYSNPPASVKIIATSLYLKKLKKTLPTAKLPDYFTSRDKTLIYEIGMTYVRSDPYTGMQLIYDYLYARQGPTPKKRHTNLALSMPNISKSQWEKAAKKSTRKDIKLYYRFRDLIQLRDAVT